MVKIINVHLLSEDGEEILIKGYNPITKTKISNMHLDQISTPLLE